MNNPLGRYSDIAALLVGVGIVFAAIAAHIFPVIAVSNTDWLDNAALVAIGVVLGQRTGNSGAAAIAQGAHLRLDAIGAPTVAAAENADKAASTTAGGVL